MSPTITNDGQSRYRTEKSIRNDPKDQLERDVQAMHADVEIDKFLDRFPNEAKFQKVLAERMVRKVLGSETGGYTQ
jgi:hypothetical protein